MEETKIIRDKKGRFAKGIPSPRKIRLDETVVIQLYKEISLNAIAKKFCCCRDVIKRILTENNVELKSSNFFLKGKHRSPETEFKKGEHHYPKNEFKKGWIPKNKLVLDISKIKEWYLNGVPVNNIAKEFNCGINPIYRILREHKVPIINKTQFKKGDSFWKGKHRSKEDIEKFRKSHLGRIPSEKTRKIQSDILKERYRKGYAPVKGKHWTLTNEVVKKMKERRKTLVIPLKDTSIEVKIQNFLKQLGISFFTHQYIQEIEHGYQCDILIPSMNLVIECDGDYWHKYPIGNEIDHVRTKELLEKGFKVLRLWEHEITEMDLNKFQEELNILKIY